MAAIAVASGLALVVGGCATRTAAASHHGVPRPIVGVHLDAGDVASADSDNAGDGYLLGGGLSFTPLWVDNVGVGAGLDVLFKYHPFTLGTSRGSNTSMPTLLTGHLLVGLDDVARWYLLLRAGFETDFNRQSTFNGTSGTSPSGTGVVAELGPIFAPVAHFAVGATLRGTVIELPAGMDHISGSNVGIVLSIYYDYANEDVRLVVP